MPLRVRQLRTPSDFEEQAAATRLRRQTTLAEQARLRETTASQQGRARVHGSLAESFAAPAREEQEVRQFETAKRQKIEEKWAREDKQRITQQGAESAFDLVQQEDRLRASGKSKLEIASTMQSLYDAEVERLGWTDRLPKPYNRSRMEMAIAQGQSMKEQIARQFELEKQEDKIRIKAEIDTKAATVRFERETELREDIAVLKDTLTGNRAADRDAQNQINALERIREENRLKGEREVTLQREKNISKRIKESASAERSRVNTRIYNKQSGRVRKLAKTVGLSGPVPQALKFFKNLSNIASETLPFLSDSELKEQINRAQADAGITNLPSALDSVDAALAGLAISAVRAVNPDRRSTVLFKMVKSLTDPSIWKSNAKILAVINELDAFVNEEGAGTVGEIAGQAQVGNIPALEQFKSDREELEELRRRKAVQ